MWNASRSPFVAIGAAAVDAAEDQGLAADLELLEAVEAGADPDVALGQRLKRAAPLAERVLEHRLRRGAHRLQPLVGVIHVGLLGRRRPGGP